MRNRNLAVAADDRNPVLPPPLDPDADLNGWGHVRIPVDLLNSPAARRATPEEVAIAVRLYIAAWWQVPAGSLPMRLPELAHLAQTTPTRLKHRFDAVCTILKISRRTDGRLWVGVAVPLVAQAWNSRKRIRHRSQAAAIKRWHATQEGGPAHV